MTWSSRNLALFALFALSACDDVPPVGETLGADLPIDAGAGGQPKLRGAPENRISTTGLIRVCFAPEHPGSAEYRAWVRDAIQREWEANSSIDFAGWETCEAAMTYSQPTVVVHFDTFQEYVSPADPNRHDIWLEANLATGPYQALCGTTQKLCMEGMSVYLFGRVLGFDEAEKPSAGYVDYTEQDQSPLDTVMRTWANPNQSGGDGTLSAGDIEGLHNAYLFRPPSGYAWVHVDSPTFPGFATAVGGGYEPTFQQTLVCRTPHAGGIVIGKWLNGACRFRTTSGESSTTNAELLFGTNVVWRQPQRFSSPIPGGESPTRTRQDVCRARRAGGIYIGMLEHPYSTARCFISVGGTSHAYNPGYFQVLGTPIES